MRTAKLRPEFLKQNRQSRDFHLYVSFKFGKLVGKVLMKIHNPIHIFIMHFMAYVVKHIFVLVSS